MQHFEVRLGQAVRLALCGLLLAACTAALPVSPDASPLAAPVATLSISDSPLAQTEVNAALTALPPKEQRACPNLDSRLLQIVEADEPLALAQQLGLPLQADLIQVALVLQTDDTAFLESLGVVVSGQSGQEVQAYAPVNLLCELAERTEIAAVRLPDLLVTP